MGEGRERCDKLGESRKDEIKWVGLIEIKNKVSEDGKCKDNTKNSP